MRLCLHLFPVSNLVRQFEYQTCTWCHQHRINVLDTTRVVRFTTPWRATADEAERDVGDWLDGPDSIGVLGR